MIFINYLWRTYLLIAFISTFSALSILYSEWQGIISNTESELTYANKIMSSSVQSLLHKYEGMLSLLGERLVEMDALTVSSPKSKDLVNKLLKNNPELAGLGLANPSGQLVLTSFNIDRSNLPNLLNSAETASTFKQALVSDHMIVGRTYYMKALQQWVIPLRFRILDIEGNVTAVMTTGLILESTNNLWSNLNLPSHLIAINVRKDMYRQYAPEGAFASKEETFNAPLDQKLTSVLDQALSKSTGYSLESLRQYDGILTTTSLFGSKQIPSYTSVSYDNVYESYTFVLTPISLLYKKMHQPIIRLAVIIILFNGLLFWLFKINISVQDQTKKLLLHQAEHDALTDLPNRRNLLNNFNLWKKACNSQFFVIFIDLNNFKNINDLQGHSTGDKILIEVAKQINLYFLECFKVRQGGDEFIILCPKKLTQNIEHYCDSFLQELRKPIAVDDLEFIITASIGIARSPENGESIDELLRKADMAMYDAKGNGQKHSIFSDELEHLETRKATIEKELTRALKNNEFFMVYQPQVNAQTKKVIGVEALIRWDSQKLGFVSPEEFIPIAEATGLIIDIGSFVLKESMNNFIAICHDLKIDQKLRLSINISVQQLLHKNFISQLKTLSNRPDFVDISIALEVTENLFIEDLATAKEVLNNIQELGMEISLDDFGTGYSSLSVLNNLPINELKIDKSFVRDIMIDNGDKNLIQSIINLGKSLNIPVLAEGVEELEQAELLLEFGCDLFQGYYFSKPLENKGLKDFLKNKIN